MRVRMGRAAAAGEALRWRRKDRVVKCEAVRAEGTRVEAEDAGGAEAPVDSTEADVVDDVAVFCAAVQAIGGGGGGIGVAGGIWGFGNCGKMAHFWGLGLGFLGRDCGGGAAELRGDLGDFIGDFLLESRKKV
ncbi:hypothetical protein M5689_008633 [Euphorbia peplus]|nr:hypothetical protein M5689_008633 [Euphorbia peplus]